MIVISDTRHIWQCLLFSVCSISLTKGLYASTMLSTYANLSSHLLVVRKRESGCTHARNCVYLSKIEIVPTITNLYHIQCQCVDKLSSLVWIKTPSSFSWQLLTKQAACGCMFLYFGIQSVAIFLLLFYFVCLFSSWRIYHVCGEFSKTTISFFMSSP